MIDVSGHSGGGKILVGGDYGGGKPIPGVVNNQSAALEDYAIATATTRHGRQRDHLQRLGRRNGNGGKVILWSDVHDHLRRHDLRARRRRKAATAASSRCRASSSSPSPAWSTRCAPNGRAGHAAARSGGVQHRSCGGGRHRSSANLSTTDVIITTGAPARRTGDITVNAAITWSSGHGLTLSAYRNVVVNADITNTTGGAPVTLRADNTGTGTGTVDFAALVATISTQRQRRDLLQSASYTVANDYTGTCRSAARPHRLHAGEHRSPISTTSAPISGHLRARARHRRDRHGRRGFTPIGNDNGQSQVSVAFSTARTRTIERADHRLHRSAWRPVWFQQRHHPERQPRQRDRRRDQGRSGPRRAGRTQRASGTISNVSVSGTVRRPV